MKIEYNEYSGFLDIFIENDSDMTVFNKYVRTDRLPVRTQIHYSTPDMPPEFIQVSYEIID